MIDVQRDAMEQKARERRAKQQERKERRNGESGAQQIAKIQSIEICDFKGFPKEKVAPLEIGGNNLLLYGENGTGKSTLFSALYHLFDPNQDDWPFNDYSDHPRNLKYRFEDANPPMGRVRLQFGVKGETSSSILEWNINEKRPDDPFATTIRRTSGFLECRTILRTHFLDYHQNSINLFQFLVEELLRDVEYPTKPGMQFGAEWKAIRTAGEQWRQWASLDPVIMDPTTRAIIGFDPQVWPDEDDEDDEEGGVKYPGDFDMDLEGQRVIADQLAFPPTNSFGHTKSTPYRRSAFSRCRAVDRQMVLPSRLRPRRKPLRQPDNAVDPEAAQSRLILFNNELRARYNRFLESQRSAEQERIDAFNTNFGIRLSEICKRANDYLKGDDKRQDGLDPSLKLDLVAAEPIPPLVPPDPNEEGSKEWPAKGFIHLLPVFRSTQLNQPGVVLNEARLTALALAIFFAALQIEVPFSLRATSNAPRLLVLDDVLTGLDMAHRLPVLKILAKEFSSPEWQIILLTFDRNWYDIAKQRLNDGTWQYIEMFVTGVGGEEKTVLLHDEDHLYRALHFLELGEFRSAAIHLRTKFELVLREACESLGVPIRYRENKHISVKEYWEALCGAADEYEFLTECEQGCSIKDHTLHYIPRLKTKKFVRDSLKTRIDHSLTWVFNGLSHSKSLTFYKREVLEAIDAVEDLQCELKHISTKKKEYSQDETRDRAKIALYLADVINEVAVQRAVATSLPASP
jgi:ABC-type uncharacterized transport system, permease and ATPase components